MIARALVAAAEKLDPVPHELAGAHRPLTLREELQRYVRQQVSQAAVDKGFGSFEDEDDFEIPDGAAEEFLSRYELRFRKMEPEGPGEALDGSDDPSATPAEGSAV